MDFYILTLEMSLRLLSCMRRWTFAIIFFSEKSLDVADCVDIENEFNTSRPKWDIRTHLRHQSYSENESELSRTHECEAKRIHNLLLLSSTFILITFSASAWRSVLIRLMWCVRSISSLANKWKTDKMSSVYFHCASTYIARAHNSSKAREWEWQTTQTTI